MNSPKSNAATECPKRAAHSTLSENVPRKKRAKVSQMVPEPLKLSVGGIDIAAETAEERSIAAQFSKLVNAVWKNSMLRRFPKTKDKTIDVYCSTEAIPDGEIHPGLFGIKCRDRVLVYMLEHSYNLSDPDLSSLKLTTAALWDKRLVAVESLNSICDGGFEDVTSFQHLDALVEFFTPMPKWDRISAEEKDSFLANLPLELSATLDILSGMM